MADNPSSSHFYLFFVLFPNLIFYSAYTKTNYFFKIHFAGCWGQQKVESSKYGRYIGELSTLAHDVAGQVYAVSDEVLFVRGFVYDGTGPGMYCTTLNNITNF